MNFVKIPGKDGKASLMNLDQVVRIGREGQDNIFVMFKTGEHLTLSYHEIDQAWQEWEEMTGLRMSLGRRLSLFCLDAILPAIACLLGLMGGMKMLDNEWDQAVAYLALSAVTYLASLVIGGRGRALP